LSREWRGEDKMREPFGMENFFHAEQCLAASWAPKESAMSIRLYDPTAEPRAVRATLAPRLDTLAGKRIGILDNGKANAGTLMLAVAEILQTRYGAGEIVKRNKPVAGPPAPEILEVLSHCDLALVGSSD
jgi:hypothetical protein